MSSRHLYWSGLGRGQGYMNFYSDGHGTGIPRKASGIGRGYNLGFGRGCGIGMIGRGSGRGNGRGRGRGSLFPWRVVSEPLPGGS